MKKIDFRNIIRYLNPSRIDNLDGLNPYRDWKAIVIFSAVSLFLVLSGGGYVFWKNLRLENEKIILDEQSLSPTINRASLSNAIETIKSREERFKKSSEIIIKDPSL